MSSGGETKVVQQPTTSTSTTEPWAEQKPFITQGFERAQTDVLNTPQQFYPGSTVIPFSPQTEAGLTAQEQRATMGSPVNLEAQNLATSTLKGDYLSSGNPAFQAMADRIDAAVRPRVTSAFEGAGRSRSAGVQSEYTRQMANAMAPLAFQNYSDERNRQLQTQQMAPQLAATDYQDIAQLLGAGTTREALGREYLGEDIARFNFNQQEPVNRLGQYMGLVGGANYGGSTTQVGSTPYYQQSSNPLLMGLGGLATLGGLFGNF